MKNALTDLVTSIINLVLELFLAVFIGALLALVVMFLWNWLMPVIFGLKTIGFLQSWGLIILSNILFKSNRTYKKQNNLTNFINYFYI